MPARLYPSVIRTGMDRTSLRAFGTYADNSALAGTGAPVGKSPLVAAPVPSRVAHKASLRNVSLFSPEFARRAKNSGSCGVSHELIGVCVAARQQRLDLDPRLGPDLVAMRARDFLQQPVRPQ